MRLVAIHKCSQAVYSQAQERGWATTFMKSAVRELNRKMFLRQRGWMESWTGRGANERLKIEEGSDTKSRSVKAIRSDTGCRGARKMGMRSSL